jgi:four helix bundle protein
VLNIAQGSLEELRYFLLLAKDLGYEEDLGVAEELDEVARLLDSYRSKIVSSAA